MIALTIVVSVHPSTPTSTRKIGGITVNQFVAGELLGRKEFDRICFYVGGKRREQALPPSNHRRVSVDSEAPACRLLVPKDGTSSQVRLNICRVGRKDVNDVLKTLSLPTWVPHWMIIVISGDVFKRFRCTSQHCAIQPYVRNSDAFPLSSQGYSGVFCIALPSYAASPQAPGRCLQRGRRTDGGADLFAACPISASLRITLCDRYLFRAFARPRLRDLA